MRTVKVRLPSVEDRYIRPSRAVILKIAGQVPYKVIIFTLVRVLKTCDAKVPSSG